ncbi:DUF2835 domain-containing protein, partial [Vibrio campbellii]|nr:DUF2835 domain-containing protein [Vibrio campbellii]
EKMWGSLSVRGRFRLTTDQNNKFLKLETL